MIGGLSALAGAAKEGMTKIIEKGAALKDNVEKLGLTEFKEQSEFPKMVAQEADTETAMNSSLESVVEANKEKLEIQENKVRETNEGKESREGLTAEGKKEIQEINGWSDEILEKIGSRKEAEIYMKARLKEVEINGKKCLIREDIDLDQADEDGITNRERMERGRPPLTRDGEEIELHHIGQKPDNPLAELTLKEHRGIGNDGILHDKTKETEINRIEFAKERRDHWKGRIEAMEGA
ncbi:HNH/ENDO VII family nuclease [Megasphaera sp.]|uniref:HNH/ENDO VII family nuclease n=2 Tax=Megasphaera TaxID=906 RepID=UPI001DDDB0BE|nr:HNH/ENDO VII family nuclease [Megasphaera sp.]MBS6789292.1 HNH/ENDO VII family nuclease [Megasphaera sp.]